MHYYIGIECLSLRQIEQDFYVAKSQRLLLKRS